MTGRGGGGGLQNGSFTTTKKGVGEKSCNHPEVCVGGGGCTKGFEVVSTWVLGVLTILEGGTLWKKVLPCLEGGGGKRIWTR